MENIISDMLKKADETSRSFTDGLSETDLKESLSSTYYSAAEKEGMTPIQAEAFSNFLLEKFKTKEPSKQVIDDWITYYKKSEGKVFNKKKKQIKENVKYPEVNVKLAGEDGNAFAIIGRVTQAMRRAGISKEEISQYRKEVSSGDYDNLLQITMKWVNIFGEDEDEDNEFEMGEGVIPNDKDSEKEKIKKLTEEDETEEEIEDEVSPEDEEAPIEDEEEKAPTDEKPEIEIKKEYVGKKGENFYYLTQVEGEGNQVEDLILSNQEEIEVFSAIKAEIDPTNLVQFIIDACKELEIEDISFDLFSKYILPKFIEEEEPKEEELEEELPSEEDFEDFMADEEPIEAEINHNGGKLFGTIRKDKIGETVFYPTKIGKKEYRFTKPFISIYTTEGKLTVKGFQKLITNVLTYESKKQINK